MKKLISKIIILLNKRLYIYILMTSIIIGVLKNKISLDTVLIAYILLCIVENLEDIKEQLNKIINK